MFFFVLLVSSYKNTDKLSTIRIDIGYTFYLCLGTYNMSRLIIQNPNRVFFVCVLRSFHSLSFFHSLLIQFRIVACIR